MKHVEYKCDYCKYYSINRRDYDKHCSRFKHLKNIKELNIYVDQFPKYENDYDTSNIILKKFKCEFCIYDTTKSSNLTRHLITCPNRINEIEKLNLEKKTEAVISQKEFEIQLSQKDLEYEKVLRFKEVEQKNRLEKELDYYKELLNLAGGMVQKTVGALTFVVNTYDDAPSIEQIQIEDVIAIKKIDNDKLVSQIFYHYNRGSLDQYIGDIIVEIYKKEDPSKQSIWSTDTSRLTYLIKKILYDDKSKWIVDKKGTSTTEYLITPIISRIRVMATEYQEKHCFGNNLNIDRVIKINDIFTRLLADIDNRKIHGQILKYISSYFFVNHKKLIEND